MQHPGQRFPAPPPSPLRGRDRLYRADDTGDMLAIRYEDFGDESAAIIAGRNNGDIVPTLGEVPVRLPGLLEATREVEIVRANTVSVPINGVPARTEGAPAPAAPASAEPGRHRATVEQSTPWVRRTLAAGLAIGVMAIPAFVVVDTALHHLGR